MSIQTQIDRLNTAKNSIASAIAEKGVTVPSGTKLDGLAALIATIEAGDGSGGDYFAYKESTWTPTSRFGVSEPIVITHNLGEVPDGFIIMANELEYGSETEYVVNAMMHDHSWTWSETLPLVLTYALGSSFTEVNSEIYIAINASDINQTTITVSVNNNTEYIPAGKEYRVLVYKR